MSRVDEALARAKAAGAEVTLPVVDQGAVALLRTDVTPDQWPAEEAAVIAAPEPEAELELPLNRGEQNAQARRTVTNSEAASEKLVLAPEIEQGSVEQYRRLAARLHLAQAEHGIKVVMVASALPGEGKTLTAVNLALTLSESYNRRVLLIDGDLRRPSVHELFKIPNLTGLNDGIKSDKDRKVPLVHWSDSLTLITAGRPDSDPMRVLSSKRMKTVISEAAAKFDWVIIDTPPVGLLTDASLFAAMVDTVVMVVQAGRTPYPDIQRAVQAIGKDRIFGVVLNRTEINRGNSYLGYGYAYSRPTANGQSG
jgi:capsular exopolysaccharide synthesis family protein